MPERDCLIPAPLPVTRPEYGYRFGDLVPYQSDRERLHGNHRQAREAWVRFLIVHRYTARRNTHFGMSACLQRSKRRSQRANQPSLLKPDRHDRKGMGRVGRCCRPPSQRWQARRAAWPTRPAARARPLGGVVPADRRAACPPSSPPACRQPAQHLRQGHERLTARPCQDGPRTGPGRASFAADVSRCLDQ
jgi:hypothetical protein